MTSEKLKEILQKGEGIDVEYKTSQFELNKDVFESICALLRKNYGRNTEEIRKNYGRNTEEIVAWMFLEPEITMEEIAQRIDKSQSTVEKTKKHN